MRSGCVEEGSIAKHPNTAVLKADGSVISWGATVEDHWLPVPDAARSGVKAMAGGPRGIVALRTDGTMVAWGGDWRGQTSVPAGLSGVTAIAAGSAHTVALLGDRVSLRATRTARELVLSWPGHATGFTLQSAPSLAFPPAWSDSGLQPAIRDGQFTAATALSEQPQFFRLRKP